MGAGKDTRTFEEKYKVRQDAEYEAIPKEVKQKFLTLCGLAKMSEKPQEKLE